jgi:hypothetical protein
VRKPSCVPSLCPLPRCISKTYIRVPAHNILLQVSQYLILTSFFRLLNSVKSSHSRLSIMLHRILDLGLVSLAFIASGSYLLYFLVQALLDPLRAIPGPFLARFTRFWYFNKVYQGSFERTEIELHKRYGPVVRIAPHEYSVCTMQDYFIKFCTTWSSYVLLTLLIKYRSMMWKQLRPSTDMAMLL